MNKQEELFRRSEKLIKVSKRIDPKSQKKPCSCNRCLYRRPDFKYRKCHFSRCPFGADVDVFRKKPLRRDKFSGSEVVVMHV